MNVGRRRDITKRKQAELKLNKSEENYRLIVKNIPIHIGATDQFGTFQMWNNYAEKMLGYKAEEVIGKFSAGVLHESEEDVKEVYRSIDEKGIYDKEINFVHKNGRIVPVHLVVIPMKSGKGDVVGFYGFAEDITERKRAQESLKKSEERYRLLVENIDLGIALIDKDYNIIMTNFWYSKFFKKPAHKFAGKKCYKEFMKQDVICMNCPCIRSLVSRRVEEVEAECVHGNYNLFSLRIKVFPTFDADGTIKGFIEVMENITEGRKMEKALRDSENKYRSIFKATGTATLIIEEDTRLSVVNSEFEKLSGYSKKELEGKKRYTQFIVKDELDKVKKYHYQRRIDPKSFPKKYEAHFIDRNNNIKNISATVAMIPGTKKSVISIMDITDYKQTLRKLFIYQEKLRSLASQLSLAEEQERRRIATELHDTIGHSLALSKIKLEALEEEVSSKDFGKQLKEIHKFIEEMINDTRSLTFQLSPPILYELGLESALEWLVEQNQEQHGILTNYEDDGQVKPLEDDIRVILFQAVRELLINIAKHARASEVKIVTKRNGESIRIEVEDNGIGFDASRLNFSLNKDFGFGIFSIRERLNHVGGSFDVESELGYGTRVTVTAPLKRYE